MFDLSISDSPGWRLQFLHGPPGGGRACAWPSINIALLTEAGVALRRLSTWS